MSKLLRDVPKNYSAEFYHLAKKSHSTNQYYYLQNQTIKRKTRLMFSVLSSLVVMTSN